MNKRLIFFFLPIFSVLIFSCKRRPVAVSEKPITPTTLKCEIENLDFTYLNLKGKIQYKDQNNEHKTNINIRMKKDSVVWMSINAAAGFEAFRILVKTDSIYILNRLTNDFVVRDYERLSGDMGVPLSFSIIQNMIVGNQMVASSPQDIVTSSDSLQCVFIQQSGRAKITNKVKTLIRKIQNVEVTDGINNLAINYLNYIPLSNYSFPTENDITLIYKDQSGQDQITKIYIEHNKAEFPDNPLNFPFNVPNRFDRK